MLKADIAKLQYRKLILEKEIATALRHAALDDTIVVHLRYRALFVREPELIRAHAKAWSSH